MCRDGCGPRAGSGVVDVVTVSDADKLPAQSLQAANIMVLTPPLSPAWSLFDSCAVVCVLHVGEP